MRDPLGWLTKSALIAFDVAESTWASAYRIFNPDPRPVCPSCKGRVNQSDEVFLHRGLVFHGRCIGYKRPSGPGEAKREARYRKER